MNFVKAEVVYATQILTKDGDFDFAKLTILISSYVRTQHGLVGIRQKAYAFTRDQSLVLIDGKIRLLSSRVSKSKDKTRSFQWVESDHAQKLDA